MVGDVMIACSVLMCHAPIVVPGLGGARAAACSATTRAMRRAARRLVEAQPDVIVVLSPHAPRARQHWQVADNSTLRGDFGAFGEPQVRVNLRGAPEAGARLLACAEESGVRARAWTNQALDHGALVPLYFVQEADYRGQTLLLAFPSDATEEAEHRLGQLLTTTAAAAGERWCVLASGDMSHRLQVGAPAGYHPRAAEFDRAFVNALSRRDYRAACNPDRTLRALAAEDVVASVRVAAAATHYSSHGAALLHYEAPFGVGYTEAVLNDHSAPPTELLSVARRALERHTVAPDADLDTTLNAMSARLPPVWRTPRPVFVTLRSNDGELRGCVGQLTPAYPSLVEEVAHCAQSAASHDPRFEPVRSDELPGLKIEVSVLDEPEDVSSAEQLDPGRYGVLVRSESRLGVLLPDIGGVETAAQQLAIARGKAGIAPDSEVRVQRFLVRKVASG